MKISNLEVVVTYRMDAGESVPSYKALRSRIKMGDLYGSDLTRQGILDPEQIVTESLLPANL